MTAELIVELTAIGVAAVVAGVGWLIVRAVNKMTARLERIYDRLDALESRAAEHEKVTALIRNDLDHLLGRKRGTDTDGD